MARGPAPDRSHDETIRRLRAQGHGSPMIAEQIGMSSSGVLNAFDRLGIVDTVAEDEPPARCSADNAVRNAFRAVLGWCPLRDGRPPYPGEHDARTEGRGTGDAMAWEVGR